MTVVLGGARPLVVALVAVALALSLLAGPAGGQEEDAQARPAPSFTLRGSGEGSGLGLSQWGARALARDGRSHTQILEHFYTGVTVDPHEVTRASDPVRVGLFHANPAVTDPTVLRLSALRADGDGAVDVRLAPDGSTHRVAAGQTWTIAFDPGIPILRPAGLVLRDAGGGAVGYGAGPANIHMATAGSPALRLPQIPDGTGSGDGSLRHGQITVTRDGDSGALRPVLRLPLEDYLLGLDVIDPSWEAAALRSQAVVSRTLAARRVAAGPRASCGCHLGMSGDDQAYAGAGAESDTWTAAVSDTAEQAVVDQDGALVEALFAPAHGGRSEQSEESWALAGRTVPALRSAGDPWVGNTELAAAYPQASWSHELDHHVLAGLADLATVTAVDVVTRTIGGTPRTLAVSGWTSGGARVDRREVTGDGIEVAGADLYLALRDRGDAPPSQQFGVIAYRDFRDVAASSVHAYNIAAIAERGVAAGRPDGTYDARAGVRRDQMATFLARALDLPLDPGAADRFDDVARDSPHRDAVNAVAAARITEGVAPRRFAPGATVTRDQMATFIARAFELDEGAQDRFTDIDDSVHRARINAVAAADITAGCSEDRYCPRLPVTRDQMASFLARALGFGW
ncbi:MAG: S-layer homology domain-containing protein [Egibacteraceae bacterium]